MYHDNIVIFKMIIKIEDITVASKGFHLRGFFSSIDVNHWVTNLPHLLT